MTLDQFIAEYPTTCQPARDWCRQRGLTDMSVIWQALCQDDQEQTWGWLQWGLRALPLPRRAALMAEILRSQPVGGGRVLLDLLTDERSRAVLPLLDRWAAGETVPADEVARVQAATDAATWAATDAATWAATDAATDAATWAATDAATWAAARAAARAAALAAALAAARAAALAAARDAARAAALAAARDATWAATWAAAWDAAQDDAVRWQRALFARSNPFEVSP